MNVPSLVWIVVSPYVYLQVPPFQHSKWITKNVIATAALLPRTHMNLRKYATASIELDSNLNGDSAGCDRTIINPSRAANADAGVHFSRSLVQQRLANGAKPAQIILLAN